MKAGVIIKFAPAFSKGRTAYMKFIDSPFTDPYMNLALEEYIFNNSDKADSCFMLWQNFKTIVIGKFQNALEEINTDYVKEHGINVARRLSGGGAVYHDSGNLNYTFITDKEEISDFDFSFFNIPLIETLSDFGIKAECTGRNDVTIDGKKFSGCSQYLKHNRLLHHGCIMLDSNVADVSQALKVKPQKFESKSVKSVRSRVTTINANAPAPISMDEFKSSLAAHYTKSDDVEEIKLSEEDLKEIEKLAKEKYSTWEWVYGRAPKYATIAEKKFPSGLVTASLMIEKGVIQNINFRGDFFGNGEISDLEDALIGAKADDSLGTKLEELNISFYISGITGDDIASLIRGI